MKIYNTNSDKKNKYYKLQQQWSNEENIDICVKLSHDNKNLIIEFDVFENEIRDEIKFYNSKVYEDSCVEIFLQNNNSKEYLNFEISVSSFILVGKGINRLKRKLFDPKLIETIKREVIVYSKEANNVHWSLKIYIDLYKWNLVEKKNISMQSVKANFYKCGDKLKSPHYLTLFNIDSEEPDFHIPKSFKELLFV